MDDERWDALVRRLEPRARPQVYRRKVVLLAALGYAFIGGLLAVLAAVALLIVATAVKGHGVILLKLLIPVWCAPLGCRALALRQVRAAGGDSTRAH
jgi:predicted membrane-bound spermidine synthase